MRTLREESGDGSDGASGDTSGEVKSAAQFTQADLDRIVGERIGKARSEMTKLAQEHKATQEALAARETELQTIRDDVELNGKSELERLQHQIEKLTSGAKKTEHEWSQRLATAERAASDASEKHISYLRRTQVSSALVAAEVVPAALDDALGSFVAAADIESDDAGNITSIIVGGKPFTSAADAAKHFLSEKPHFAKAAAGGSGTKRRAGLPGDNGTAPASPAQMISMGRSTRPD